MTEIIGHVRGAIVNPKTGQPTKLFYDILSRISSDTETVIREQFPWSLSIEANQVVDTGSLVLGSSGVSSADVVTNIIHQSIPVQEWFETTVQQDYTIAVSESVTVNASNVTVTFPTSAAQGERFRVIKGVSYVRFRAESRGLYIGTKGYSSGSLPGGKGSVLEFEFSNSVDGWIII